MGATGDIIGGVIGGASIISNTVLGGIGLGIQRDAMEGQLALASRAAEDQMRILEAQMEEARAAGESDRALARMRLQAEIDMARAAAEASGSSTDVAALMALVQQSQRETSGPWWPWALGAVGILGGVGITMYFLFRE